MWNSSPSPKYGRTSSGHMLASASSTLPVKCASSAGAQLLQHGVRFRQVLARRALALDEVRDRVDAKPVDAEVQPELHHLPDFFANRRVVVVEVRLMAEEPVPVVRLRDRIPGPVRELGVDEDDADAAIAIVGVAPDVPIAARVVRGAARFLKPGVLIRRVVQHELDDDAQPAGVRLAQEASRNPAACRSSDGCSCSPRCHTRRP